MAYEDDIPVPSFRKPISQRDSFADDPSADINDLSIQPDPPLPGTTITPESHQRRIPHVRFSVPVSKKNRLVPRYEMEGTPAPSNNTDSSASGNGGGGGSNPDPSTLTQIQIIQSQIDCFNIVCNDDGTLSWTFECSE